MLFPRVLMKLPTTLIVAAIASGAGARRSFAESARTLEPYARLQGPSAVRDLGGETPSGIRVISYEKMVEFVDRAGHSVGRWFAPRSLGYNKPTILPSGLIAIADEAWGVHVLNSNGKLQRTFNVGSAPWYSGVARVLPNGIVLSLDWRGGALRAHSDFGELLNEIPIVGAHSPFFEPALCASGVMVASIDFGDGKGRILLLDAKAQIIHSREVVGRTFNDPVVMGDNIIAVARLDPDQHAHVYVFDRNGSFLHDFRSTAAGPFRIQAFANGSLALIFASLREQIGSTIEFRSADSGTLLKTAMIDTEILHSLVTDGSLYIATKSDLRVFAANGVSAPTFTRLDARGGLLAGRDGAVLAVGDSTITRIRAGFVESTISTPQRLVIAQRFGNDNDNSGDALFAVPAGVGPDASTASSVLFYRLP